MSMPGAAHRLAQGRTLTSLAPPHPAPLPTGRGGRPGPAAACWWPAPALLPKLCPAPDPQISAALAEVVQRHLGVPASRLYIKL